MRSLAVFFGAFFLFAAHLPAGPAEPETRDIVFAKIGGHELKLDLYLPKDVKKPPLVVFIHGGGWQKFSYKQCHVPWLTEYGFAVASVDYRLADQAIFPAQVHDVKGAIRWLRAHETDYGYDSSRIAVAGTSAGGYLALMMGTTNGDKELEGETGGATGASSEVQAIVDYFGPADFVLRSQNHPVRTEPENSPVYKLLGVAASKDLKLAEYASPAYHVTSQAPPLLILHGDKDEKVFMEQSERMLSEYKKAGRDASIQIVAGGGHGGGIHFSSPYREVVVDFLRKHLQGDRESEPQTTP